MNNSSQKLKTILQNETQKLKDSFPFDKVVFPLIEIVRSLDYFTYVISLQTDDKKYKELYEKWRYGWSLAYSLFIEKLDMSDNIPLFSYSKEERDWLDYVISQSGYIQMCNQFLNYEKADLLALQYDGDSNFTFSYLSKNIGIEYYDRKSLEFCFSIIRKILEPKIENVLSKEQEIKKEISKIVSIFKDKYIQYQVTEEIEYFYTKLGYFHLMTTQIIDDFDENDLFGGIPYKEYLDVLEKAIISALMHRDCCLTLCEKTNFEINLRDILSYAFSYDSLKSNISRHFDWSENKCEQILSCLCLNKENFHYHIKYPAAPSAPYFQIGEKTWMRSDFGCTNMPVFFLNRELKRRYNRDYFNAVNQRERRFKKELYELISRDDDRIISIDENINITKNDKIITDIDAILYDKERQILGLFQLKWQDPYFSSMKERYSRMTNLFPKSIEWVDKIMDWISSSNEKDILNTCKITADSIKDIHLFVISRHTMNFTNQELDDRASWGSWYQLIEADKMVENYYNSNPIGAIAAKLKFFRPSERDKRESIKERQLQNYEFKLSDYQINVSNEV